MNISRIKSPINVDSIITKDKWYEVIYYHDKYDLYEIVDDEGWTIVVNLNGCDYIKGNNWQYDNL